MYQYNPTLLQQQQIQYPTQPQQIPIPMQQINNQILTKPQQSNMPYLPLQTFNMYKTYDPAYMTANNSPIHHPEQLNTLNEHVKPLYNSPSQLPQQQPLMQNFQSETTRPLTPLSNVSTVSNVSPNQSLGYIEQNNTINNLYNINNQNQFSEVHRLLQTNSPSLEFKEDAVSTSSGSIINQSDDEWNNMNSKDKNNFNINNQERVFNPTNINPNNLTSTENEKNAENSISNNSINYPYMNNEISSLSYNDSSLQIKQPPNAFILFSVAARQKIKKENPNSSLTYLSKLVGEAWKNLPEVEKSKYYEEANRLRNESKNLKKLAKEQQKHDLIGQFGQSGFPYPNGKIPASISNIPRKRYRTPKDPTQPKHPSSAFIFFRRDARHKYINEISKKRLGEVSKLISEAWKNLSEEEKAKYVKKSEDDKKRYNEEMKVWIENNKNKKKNTGSNNNSSSASSTPTLSTSNAINNNVKDGANQLSI